MNALGGNVLRIIAIAIAVAWLAPLALHAQTATGSSDLRATIEAALLSDPRSSGMSQAQFEGMVDALTQQAQRQGVTAQDVGWRPQAQPGAAESACGGPPSFLCDLSTAFGFVGADPLISVALGITSALLLFVIGMLLHRLGHHVRGSFEGVKTPDTLHS